MKLYKTRKGPILEAERCYHVAASSWDELLTRDDLDDYLRESVAAFVPVEEDHLNAAGLLAPIGSQEVWAAGVTYQRSCTARIEESESAGGGDFYDRVYRAERPELFFKATPHRVVGPGEKVAIRGDARWSVPEPELALLVSPTGKILGYTIANDMSSRDIEGENPLYLPQAKIYDRCCALGPCILISRAPLGRATAIRLEILRHSEAVFAGQTSLEELKREPASLIRYLFRDNSFPSGCFLLTGTGIVPPDSFTLKSGDEIRIAIEGIGTLVNSVA
ncbi:MAG: fumarylacetoacetate hydrolase family protein [Acidobacteria bacterium]|nr:fumarylacetoacetate hydrolase family protein [Acidobacteriota bacterium]